MILQTFSFSNELSFHICKDHLHDINNFVKIAPLKNRRLGGAKNKGIVCAVVNEYCHGHLDRICLFFSDITNIQFGCKSPFDIHLISLGYIQLEYNIYILLDLM